MKTYLSCLLGVALVSFGTGVMAEAAPRGFFRGPQASARNAYFELKDQNKRKPVLVLMNKNGTERQLAKILTMAGRHAEKNVSVRNKMPVEDKVRLEFDAIGFHLDAHNPERVTISMITPTHEFEIANSISRRALERGDQIDIQLEPASRDYLSYSVSGEAALSFHYLPGQDAIQIDKLSGKLRIDAPIFGEVSDSAQVRASGRRISSLARREKLRI
jgi:hypothetical protein